MTTTETEVATIEDVAEAPNVPAGVPESLRAVYVEMAGQRDTVAALVRHARHDRDRLNREIKANTAQLAEIERVLSSFVPRTRKTKTSK